MNKKYAITVCAGIMAFGLLTGCGSKNKESTDIDKKRAY